MQWIKNNGYWLALIGIIIVTGLIYSNVVHGPPLFDDIGYIKSNDKIRDITDIGAIWNAWKHPARFVGYLTFAINYHFHGYEWFGYHVTNIAIHMTNILLVWSLVHLLFQTGAMRHDKFQSSASLIALLTAMFFAAHPMQTQAVSYMAQRFASLATLFYLLSCVSFLKARLVSSQSIMWFLLAGVSALLGMFTKQITITLPVTLLLMEFMFVRGSLSFKKLDWRVVGGVIVFLLIVPAIFKFNVTGILSIHHHSGSHRGDQLNNLSYFFTQLRVICTYLNLMFLPIGQNLLYDFTASYSLLEPKAFWSFVLLMSIFGFGVYQIPRNRLMAFGIFWFFIALSVESSIIVIKHVIFEHRMYLPSFGFFLAVAMGLVHLFRSQRKCIVTGLIIFMTLSILTYQRNFVWTDDIVMWCDVIAKSPEKSRPYMNLGIAYVERGEWERAVNYLSKAIDKYGRNHAAYSNRGMAHFAMGQPDKAIQDFNRAIAIKPDYQEALINRGNYYSFIKNLDAAIADYDKVITRNPQAVEAIHNRANKYFQLKQYERALQDYDRAIDLRPSFVRGYASRGQVYSRLKQFDLALDDFNQAIALDQANESALLGRASLSLKKGDLHLALDDYNRLLKIKPNHTKAQKLRGRVLAVLKKQDASSSDP